ncbi:hypothetical protein BU15DRAFT_64182 [Melanogaster broomeanus]|nr:hypothetical protein BU15DRAFT_64182 [Melanogaster broomeanus]
MTLPDLSLGSLVSGISTPGRVPKRPRGTPGKGVTLTLRDQEKHIDNLKKEKFNIKLRVHFLEERLAQLAPDQVDAALKQNVSLKVEVQQRGLELKKLKRLVLELERGLERSQTAWERDIEAQLQQRERELRELRRGLALAADEDALRQADERGEHRRERWQRKLEELEAKNDDLRARNEEQNELLLKKEDEKEDLIEDLQRRREAESIERSESRAQVLEAREEREAVEDDLNAIRDKLAATMIELSQKEDEIDMKNKEIDDLVAEHDQIVAVVEEEWRGEVEEVRGQVEELRDAPAERETESKELRLNISELEASSILSFAMNDSALDNLAKTETLLEQRQSDLKAVQDALKDNEEESKKLGDSHTTAKFSLQLEVDRLKRDIQTLEDALSRARQDIAAREGDTRERDLTIDNLHNEVRDLTTRLGNQTQARLHLSEKFDATQASLKAAEVELSPLRTKVHELEARLAKDQKSLLNSENQYRDQLTERNTLLLTIYQYMDKILGVDKTPKKGNQAETKPFTNFNVFHDNLITRLKALSQIQLDFDKRVKEAEARFTEKLTDMRKQLDTRWKQIDKFETSVKAYGDAKATWRRKYISKDDELEALKATNAELAQQLTVARRPAQGDSQEVRTLLSRAVNAEKRLVVANNQLLQHEEKISSLNQKTSTADTKWEARVKEYEARLKAAEEKYKRERQGSKERVLELENQIRSLERQHEIAQKRNAQLATVAETAKTSSNTRTRDQ